MKKALAGMESALIKSLDAMVKDAGLKTTGKEALTKLRRERFSEAQTRRRPPEA